MVQIKNNDTNPTDQDILEDDETDEEQPLYSLLHFRSSIKLTPDFQVHNIDSSLDKNNFENIAYVNKDGNFEIFCGYLDPCNNNDTKQIMWASEAPSTES